MKRLLLLASSLLVAVLEPLGSCTPRSVVLPASAPQRHVASGLIAHYLMNGGAADSSGHGRHGIVHGALPAEDIAGAAGGAYSFSGADSRVELPDSLIENHRSLSVTLWFRTGAGGVLFGYQSLAYSLFAPTEYVPAMYVGMDGRAYAEFWNGGDTPIASATAVNDDRWHFMALTAEDSVQTLIIDSTVVGSMPGKIDHLHMIYNQLGLGNTGVGNGRGWAGGNDRWFGFKGSLDNVRLYDRALTAAECDTLYRFKE